jgi:hypothetical protein
MTQPTPGIGSPHRVSPARGVSRPDDAYEEPDPDWPEDGPPAPPWTSQPGHGAPGDDAKQRRPHALTMAAVAVIAATLGVVVALLIANRSPSAPSATSSPPSAAAPALGGNGAISGGGGGGGEMFAGGKVVAASPTSITLTGQGQQITAAITSSTKFTGVSSASKIKVGDLVMAQISGYGTSHPVAITIQDPAQFP